MKSILVLALGSVISVSIQPFALAKTAADIPACANIVKSCEAAGFEPGEHKKTGKGLWVDCVHQIAMGKTVPGVTATVDEAKACAEAKKATRAKRGK